MTAKTKNRSGRKRGDGEGSIVQRKDGLWQGSLMVGRTFDGKADRRTVYAKTRADVQTKLGEIRRLAQSQMLPPSHSITFRQFAERWLADVVAPSRRASTTDTYRSLLTWHAYPAFGDVRLSALRPMHVQHLYRAMLDKGLSPGTIRIMHSVLHAALDQAIKWGEATRNVVEVVTPPSNPHAEMQTLTALQCRTLLRVAEESGDRFAALWRLLLDSGCRIGEALALTWADLQPERRTMTIRRTLVSVKDGSPVTNEPKTARSRRTVTLTPTTVSALAQHRIRQHEDRLRAGAAWAGHDLVFATQFGSPYTHPAVHAQFVTALKRAGVGRIRMHDLRHTSATLALEAGVNPRVIADRLGHSSITMTLTRYSHVTESMESEAVAKLAAALGE